MLDNQQIYGHIPKKVINWSCSDVYEWFRINEIELNKQINMNGQQFLNLKGNKLFNEYGLSMYMTRKVLDWIENEVDSFDEYVEEMIQESSKGESNQNHLSSSHEQKSSSQQLIENQSQSIQSRSLSPNKDSSINNSQSLFHHPKLFFNKHNSDQNQSISDHDTINDDSSQSQSNQDCQNQENKVQHQEQNWNSFRNDDDQDDENNDKNVNNKQYEPVKCSKWRGSNGLGKNCNLYGFKIKSKISIGQGQILTKSQQYPIKPKKPISKKNPLMLSDLNGFDIPQNNQDIQTSKNIPERDNESVSYSDQSTEINKISSLKDMINKQKTNQFEQNVKFIKSCLVMPTGSMLTAYFQNSFLTINKNVKIGRNSYNDISLKSEGVSRNHAEIIIEEQLDSKGNKQKRYYLRDVGSKYGTFVQIDPQKPKKVSEHEEYCVGTTNMRIDKLKLHKSKQKFDITLFLVGSGQQQRVYQNKSLITIGNRKRQPQAKQQQKSSQQTKRSMHNKQKRDVELEDPYVRNNHCRFVIISGEVYLQQVQGNIFQRIQKNVKYPLNRIQSQVKFGDGNVVFRLQQIFKTVINDD